MHQKRGALLAADIAPAMAEGTAGLEVAGVIEGARTQRPRYWNTLRNARLRVGVSWHKEARSRADTGLLATARY